MDKQIINVSLPAMVKIEFNKQDIMVNAYISLKNKTKFINDYVSSYFGVDTDVDNYIQAEYALILNIVDELTNVSVVDDNREVNIDIDSLIGSNLWQCIKDKIVNYNELRADIYEVVKLMREQKALDKSVGTVLDDIKIKVFGLVDKLSELDLSEEGIGKLLGKIQEVAKDYEDKFGMKPVVEDVPKISRKKKEILQ